MVSPKDINYVEVDFDNGMFYVIRANGNISFYYIEDDSEFLSFILSDWEVPVRETGE